MNGLEVLFFVKIALLASIFALITGLAIAYLIDFIFYVCRLIKNKLFRKK